MNLQMPYHAVHTCMVDLLYEFYYGFSNDMSLKMLYRRRHRQFDMFGSAGIYDGHLRVRFCNLAWYKKQAGYNYWPWYVQTIFFFYTVNKNSLVMRFGLRLLEIFSKLACKSCFFLSWGGSSYHLRTSIFRLKAEFMGVPACGNHIVSSLLCCWVLRRLCLLAVVV